MSPSRWLFCLPLLACAVQAQSVRDSAGIQIVVNTRPSAVIRVAAQPTVVIGTQSGDAYLFSGLRSAARLADGTIVVANGGSHQLRYFDANGRHVRSVGQKGSGPGDFESIELFARLPGDTLVAGSMMARYSYFTSNGTFVRDGPKQLGLAGLPPGPKPILGVLADQSIVIVIPNLRPESKGRPQWVDSSPVFVVDRTGAHSRAIGVFPMMTMVAKNGEPDIPGFGATAALAAGKNELYVGFGSQYSIKVVNPDGRTVRIIRRSWTPRRVTAAEIDTYVEAWADFWIKSNDANGAQKRRELRNSTYAQTIPAFSEFRVDAKERLWVREPNLADAPSCGCLNEGAWGVSTWSVFDTAGRWVSDVKMPPRFHPTDIGADYILGVLRDDDGVATVAMYRLTG